MAKHVKKSKKDWILPLVLGVVFLALLAALLTRKDPDQPRETKPQQTRPQHSVPLETTESTEPEESEPQRVEVHTPESVLLEDDLVVKQISGYSGIFMEDGTEDIVTDVMMIILENTSNQDLQLARLEIEYPTFTAEFEVTSLPAGESVSVQEKNRHEMVAEEYTDLRAVNVVFFPEPMDIYPELLEISGVNGSLEVTNISGEDIPNDFYVYYKNSTEDMLYGGITYRVRIDGGLEAGASKRVVAGHFRETGSRILMVTGLE